jgi:hypothetical protein
MGGKKCIGQKSVFHSPQEQLFEAVFTRVKYLANYVPDAYRKSRTIFFMSRGR